MDFGYTLRTMRKAAGISLRRLAKDVGVSAAYLSQVERGTLPPPTLPRLKDIARVLEIPEMCLTGLTARLSTEVLDFVAGSTDVSAFLRAAQQAGLTGGDFHMLADTLEHAGRRAWLDAIQSLEDVAPHATAPAGQAVLSESLDPRLLHAKLPAATKRDVLAQLCERLSAVHPTVSAELALSTLLARENESSTGIGMGIAVPHATLAGLSDEALAVATCPQGIDFASVDGAPVRAVFLLVGSATTRPKRLVMLARIAQLAAQSGCIDALCDAHAPQELAEVIRRCDSRSRQ